MTDNHHPITPPPELVQQWFLSARAMPVDQWVTDVATQAARWGADQQLKLDTEQINQAWQKGADQELEACCEWLNCELGTGWGHGTKLRAARRPKPPSLKERAMQAMDRVDVIWATDEFGKETMDDINAIRRALESLPD